MALAARPLGGALDARQLVVFVEAEFLTHQRFGAVDAGETVLDRAEGHRRGQ